MAKRVKNKKINLATQALALRKYWKERELEITQSRLCWRGHLTPTPISPAYEVLLTYSLEAPPEIFILRPQLIRNEAGKLPHVYSIDGQKLCLHFPPEKRWHAGKLLAVTIMPWISEWLFFYEIWVATDVWKGGGTHKEDQKFIDMHYAA